MSQLRTQQQLQTERLAISTYRQASQKIPYNRKRKGDASTTEGKDDPDDLEIISAGHAQALAQLQSLKQHNKRLQTELDVHKRKVEHLSATCGGCSSPLLDQPRLLANCCKQPICIDCQGRKRIASGILTQICCTSSCMF